MFDLLLKTEFFTPFSAEPLDPPKGAERTTDTAEQVLNQLCLWASEERFRVDVHLLQGLCATDQGSRRLSEIADSCICQVTEMARLDMYRRYGRLPEERFAVIALGRLGSQQLTAISDADLMFVYDSHSETPSDGPQSLEAGQYYNRLSQLIISWLSMQTAKGRLFDVDTRLRPDGQSGALAIKIDRLSNYFANDAWPWEYCAFLKARPIYIDEAFSSDLYKTLINIRTNPPALPLLVEDIKRMRQRLNADPTAPQSLKKRSGGFLDAEFLVALLAVQSDHQVLSTDPASSSKPLLSKLLGIIADEDGVRTVCAGLRDLELIIQITALCLGKSSVTPSVSENPQTWLALADRLNLNTAVELQLHIEKICGHTASMLARFLEPKAN